MKQENYDYLKDQIRKAGFGESLDNALKEKMESQDGSFQLKQLQKIGKDDVEATLNFRKSVQSENFYFNSYEMLIEQVKNKPALKQTFYVGKENNYAVDEAYNLMSHRFVNKDLVNRVGEPYNSWDKLDFKQTDVNGNYKIKHYKEGYGFDLEKALERVPMIKELADQNEKAKLIESLKRGNRQEVILVVGGEEKKGFAEANAYGRSVTVFDEHGKLVQMAQNQKESEKQGEKQGQKNDENRQDNGKKKRVRQKQSQS